MTRRSVKIARLFGFILFALISAWDVDAMRPHIAAHSWTTLAFVSLFLAAHLSDYFTLGRLVSRLDPLFLRNADEIVGATAECGRSLPSVDPGQTPGLYVFTVVTAIEAQASARPIPSLDRASPCNRSGARLLRLHQRPQCPPANLARPAIRCPTLATPGWASSQLTRPSAVVPFVPHLAVAAEMGR